MRALFMWYLDEYDQYLENTVHMDSYCRRGQAVREADRPSASNLSCMLHACLTVASSRSRRKQSRYQWIRGYKCLCSLFHVLEPTLNFESSLPRRRFDKLPSRLADQACSHQSFKCNRSKTQEQPLLRASDLFQRRA